jgi:predicted phage tail protein
MPVEAPNTLRSRARYKIIDILGQGPMVGLVNGARSVFLNDTPIQATDGTLNFKNFEISKDLQELPIADITGQIIKYNPALFPLSENEVDVSTKVTKDSPEGSLSGDGSVTRTITDTNVDSVRVTVRVPALTTTDTTTGDINGGVIDWQISVRPDGGVFQPTQAGLQWQDLAAHDSETSSSAIGIRYTTQITRNTAVGTRVTWQYRKKTGGSWGAWITYRTKSYASSSSSAYNVGYYNATASEYVSASVDGLEAGIYQAQVVVVGGTSSPLAAAELIERGLIISGKTVSPYDADYIVQLPGTGPWDIKVSRISADPPTANIQAELYWLSYTEQISNRFSWPNTAGVAVTFDAEDFGGQIPARSYDVMGLIVKVPANYDAYNRTYSGVWNGTFKDSWTDNPAWIFYDLLTNKRYGLGDNIDAAQIDKYALYQIAQYCDELVDAPNGELEPRYTCSCVINSQSEAYELLTAIASAFRGMIYLSGGTITPTADMPTDSSMIVGPANVIDGIFTYQGASRKARHTVARVTWNNPDDGYKLNVELYEDDEAIRKYGYRPIDINAFGCTSRGLARRWGKWAITSDNDAPDTVTYKAGFDHFARRPGDVVSIADPNYSGEQLFGLIADVTDNVSPATHTITLDRAVTRVAGDTSELQLTLADGTILALDVAVTGSDVTSAEITVDSVDLTTMPLVGASWLLKKGTVEPRQWRIISISEDEPHIYQVTAMLYDPNKFDKVETDLNFAEADFTAFPSGPMPAPTGVAQSEFLKQTGSAILACVNLSWTRPNDPRADWFEVQYQLDGEEWRTTEPNLTQFTGIDIINIVPGVYNFRVRAQDTSGLFRSAWTTLASQTLLGKDKAPEDVTGFTAVIEKYGVLLNWSPVSDIDINYYEIRMGGTGWDDATFVGRTAGTTYKYEDQTTATLTFRIKARDTNDNWSINATSTNSTGETQNVPTVTTISIPIGIQVDIAGELKRGFSHWELRRRVYSTGVATTINTRLTTRIYFDEAYDDLVFGEAYEYSARAYDTNGVASDWSDYSSPVFPLQIQSNDITANQIVAKDFRTAQDVGDTVDGVKFTAAGIEMWEDGTRKVFIPVTGDPEFYGLLTAAAGNIGGWEIFPTYLQSNNIRLDSAGLLQTLDFVSGNNGWRINQTGDAEFNNIRARGAVKTVVFEKDEISVVGGKTLIRPAGIVTNYDYEDFLNAAADEYLEECWDKLNELLGTSYTYVAPTFADYDEYYAAELAYYNELGVAMGFNQFTCAILEADYDDATKDAYLTACWAQLMDLLDLTTATPAIPSMTFAAYETLENGYFDEVATAIDNPPLFEPFINDSDTAIETENADQFKVGDIIRVKDGLANDYWGRISAISGNILSITGESGEPWDVTAGQTIVSYGIPGSGGILLDGQAPLIDVYTHAGAPWNGTDIRVRIGNLNGWGIINDDIYGIAIGSPVGEYLVYDAQSGRLRMNGSIEITEGTGIANLTDAGALASKDNIDLSYVTDAGAVASANNLDGISDGTTHKKTTANEKTGAGRAYSGLDSSNSLITKVLPGAAIGTPAGAGLYLGSDKMGYYNGGWKTYMDNAGQFYLCGASGGLAWNGTSLTICGDVCALSGTFNGTVCASSGVFSGTVCSCAGNIGGWTLANGCLSATNAALYSGAANTARIQLGTGACAGGINSANAGTDILFWGGNTHANRATAPFRVTAAGALTATNATICGTVCASAGQLGCFSISSGLLCGTNISLWCGIHMTSSTCFSGLGSNRLLFCDGALQSYMLINCSRYQNCTDGGLCCSGTFGALGFNITRRTGATIDCSEISFRSTQGGSTATLSPLLITMGGGTSCYAFCTNGRISVSGTVYPSDRNLKTDFEIASVLPALRKTPIAKWRYKDSKNYQFGPVAQDFNPAFQLVCDWQTNLTVSNLDGIALRGVQELDECITSLQCKIQKLECEFAAIKERIN